MSKNVTKKVVCNGCGYPIKYEEEENWQDNGLVYCDKCEEALKADAEEDGPA